MEKKAARRMTQTYIVPIPIKVPMQSKSYKYRALTMIELMVVIVMMSMFVIMVKHNILGLFNRGRFERQVFDMISTIEKASIAASSSERRYEFIIDIDQQSYTLREITTPDLSVVLEEEIIASKDLSEGCSVAYVEFDDETWTNNGVAKFRAGRAGWVYGGKIVMLDEDKNAYSIVIGRLSRNATLEEGDVDILKPRDKDEMAF